MKRLVLALALWSSMASAQAEGGDEAPQAEHSLEASEQLDQEARMEFEAGLSAYRSGRFEIALVHYERAHSLSQRPAMLFNIANTQDRLGRWSDALQGYRAFLEAVPNPSNKSFVEGRIRELDRMIEERDAQDEASEEQELEATPAPEPAPSEPESASPVGPIVLFALAGAAGVAGIGTGIASFGARSDLEDMCSADVCPTAAQSHADKMQRLAISTDILLGVSLAAFVVGLVLQLTSDRDEPQSASVRCTPLGCAGRF